MVALSLAAVVSATAIYLLQSQRNLAQSDQTTPSTLALSQYSVLTRAETSADALPASAGLIVQVQRSIQTGDGSLRQWITLDGNQICVVVSGGPLVAGNAPSACNSIDTLEADHEILFLGASSGYVSGGASADRRSSSVLAGIAPNDVGTVTVTYADGSTQTANVLDNGFHFETGGQNPQSISWTTPAGAMHEEG
jgi:hypothetical protein